MLGLIVLNGLLAMSEMALLDARLARLQKLSDQGDKGAAAAIELAEDPARLISTIQIGITSIAICLGVLSHIRFANPLAVALQEHQLIAPITAELMSTILIVIIVSYIALVIGVLVPKHIGQHSPETIARIAARPIRLLSLFSKPILWLLSISTRAILRLVGLKSSTEPSVTQEEFHAMLEEGTESGLIDAQEHQMLRNVFRLEDRKIVSLMVPRLDVIWLSVNDPIEITLKKISASPYTRFPVCRESVNDLLGLVNAKNVLSLAVDGQLDSLE
ncbi:MAG: hemolysin family protein, partial [Pseudomonadota bacterium]|nr:hemolysin family protein [Pseudomonadota bacterium]